MRRKKVKPNRVGRPVDPKTDTLYAYVEPKTRAYVKTMREYFGSESDYVNQVIKHDMEFEALKRIRLKKLKKEAERLHNLQAHDKK